MLIMFSTNITQSTPEVQTRTVYEYALIVHNAKDNDTQNLTAAFTFIPTSHDWLQWLSGWTDCGYLLSSPATLINVI
jgi:hypothetical protein